MKSIDITKSIMVNKALREHSIGIIDAQ